MPKLSIEILSTPDNFAQAKAYLDAAKTPAERNIRKMQLHTRLYSIGPQKLSELIGMKALGTIVNERRKA